MPVVVTSSDDAAAVLGDSVARGSCCRSRPRAAMPCAAGPGDVVGLGEGAAGALDPDALLPVGVEVFSWIYVSGRLVREPDAEVVGEELVARRMLPTDVGLEVAGVAGPARAASGPWGAAVAEADAGLLVQVDVEVLDDVPGRARVEHDAVVVLRDGPFLMVTLSKPSLRMAAAMPLPSMVWPSRSIVMLCAPTTRPSHSQSTRSLRTTCSGDDLAAEDEPGCRRLADDQVRPGGWRRRCPRRRPRGP